jgi:hypothetical protein
MLNDYTYVSIEEMNTLTFNADKTKVLNPYTKRWMNASNAYKIVERIEYASMMNHYFKAIKHLNLRITDPAFRGAYYAPRLLGSIVRIRMKRLPVEMLQAIAAYLSDDEKEKIFDMYDYGLIPYEKQLTRNYLHT